MAMDTGEIAELLRTGLSLSESPVQISYLKEEPVGIEDYAGEVPSGCTYWGVGTSRPFYARLSGHLNCEIGAFVMGLTPKGALKEKLSNTIGWMEDEGYLAKGEASSIPRLAEAPAFVCYGPLGSVKYRPDVVIMFLEPQAAMLALESAGQGGAHPFHVPVTGRPACSIIPHILNGGEDIAISFGCAGFRTYVDKAAGKVLLAVRGEGLERFSSNLRRTLKANEAVSQENEERKRSISG